MSCSQTNLKSAASLPLDAFDFGPNFPEYVAPHPLLKLVALEIVGMQRFTDDNLCLAELIALCRLFQGEELSGQFCYLFLKQVRDVVADRIETLKPRDLIFQKIDPNFTVRAVLRARADRANSHFWLPIPERRHFDAFRV
jgi:hypothetical protein